MLINRLAAFGRLENGSLELRPGLNVIEIPEEGRRSLWASLLPILLYGPESGQAPGVSQATLDASTFRGGVTLARWTAAPDAPLGSFSAVYTGTAQPVEWLDGAGCGGALLGLTREVFLERAVIPASGTLEALDRIPGILEQDLAEHSALQEQIARIEDALARHDGADLREAAVAAENAQLEFASARDRARTLSASVKPPPSRSELLALRASLDSLEEQNTSVALAKQDADLAARALQFAQSARDAGRPPAPEGDEPPRPRPSPPLLLAALLAGLALGGAVEWFSRNWLAALGGGLGLLGLILLAQALPLARRRKQWDARHRELTEQRERAEAAYTILMDNAAKAKDAYDGAMSAYRQASERCESARERILNRLRSFRPFVRDTADARQAIAAALLLRRELDQASEREEAARSNWEALRADAVYPLPPAVRRPPESREQLRRQLAEKEARLDALQAHFSITLEERAAGIYTRLTQSPYRPDCPDSCLGLAQRLAVCSLALPPAVPLVLDGPLDALDGLPLTAALDCLVELAQTRQVLLLTALDREAACLRRTHPDRFHSVKL